MLLDPVQQSDAEAVRCAQIGNDQVRNVSLHELHGLDLGGRFINLIPFLAKQGGQRGARRPVIVDNQDSFQAFRSPPITPAVPTAVDFLYQRSRAADKAFDQGRRSAAFRFAA